MKNSKIFHISAQNIDCKYSLEPPRRGGSNEYQQAMFWAEIWKIMYTPVNHTTVLLYKSWVQGLYKRVFVMNHRLSFRFFTEVNGRKCILDLALWNIITCHCFIKKNAEMWL